MKLPSLAFALLLLLSQSWAQDSLALRYAATMTPADLRAHLTFLADDLLEGRETGERGQQLAGIYLRSQLMKMGLPGGMPDGSYFQPFYLRYSSVVEANIQVRKEKFSYGDDFLNYRSDLPANLKGEWVFAGYGMSAPDYHNLDGLEVAGKQVLMLAGGPEPFEGSRFEELRAWRARTDALEALGADKVVMLLPDSSFALYQRFIRREQLKLGEAAKASMPILLLNERVGEALLKGAKSSRNKLVAALAEDPQPPALRFDKLKLKFDGLNDASVKPASNVLAFLEGSEKPEEVLVLTAHYDHIGINRKGEINNGADDDGSGSSSLLEIAEAFAQAAREGHRPRRSILFMWVSGEEKGLLGSQFYVEHPVYPLAQTVANLNVDMIGRIDTRYEDSADSLDYVYVIGSDKLSSELHALSEATNETYSQLLLDYKYNDPSDPNRYYYRSDHYNFARNGIPVIFYFTGVHADYHQPTDDVEKIHFEKLTRIARLIFHTGWELAWREQRPRVDVGGE